MTDAEDRTLRAVSLFTNCGAGDTGFNKAGFQLEVLAEIDSSRLAVASRNHAEAAPVEGDLRRTWERVVNRYRERVDGDRLDLLSACPPCQGMSSANADRGPLLDKESGGRDRRNLLVLPIAEVAWRLNPRVVVVENVPAFLRRHVPHPDTGEGISAAALLVELLREDYRAFPLLVDLAQYGIPQRRQRAFLTFVRRDLQFATYLKRENLSPYPGTTHGPEPGKEDSVSLGEFLSEQDLASLDANPDSSNNRSDEYPLHAVPVWKKHHYRMVQAIPANSGGSAWENDYCFQCGQVDADPEAAACPTCGDALLRPVIEDEDGLRLIKGFRHSSYKRQNPDKPANTVTTASGQIGSASTIHPSENRVLSVLECARLQTIPDDFDWGDQPRQTPGLHPIRRMIGEAVPPLFTEMHGRVLAAGLRNERPQGLMEAKNSRVKAAIEGLRKGGLTGSPDLEDVA